MRGIISKAGKAVEVLLCSTLWRLAGVRTELSRLGAMVSHVRTRVRLT